MGVQIVRASDCHLSFDGAPRFHDRQEVGDGRFFPLDLFEASAWRFGDRQVWLQCLVVGNDGGRSRQEDVGRRVRRVVLFPGPRAFVLRLLRRSVRGVSRTVNLVLPGGDRAAARVLFTW